MSEINKDWTGNKKSIFTCLGSSSHALEERERDDFYATDPLAGKLLLEIEPQLNRIWECAVGTGELAKVFEEQNKLICVSDIIDRNYKPNNANFKYGEDFLQKEEKEYNCDIVTNPPYKCFSDDTECYSKRGWLKYNEILKEDEILSVNPETLELQWSKINTIIIKQNKDIMYNFKHNNLDILCTKDHRMFAFKDNKLLKKNNDLILSQDIRGKHYIPRLGYNWVGNNQDFFILPAINGHRYAQPVFKEQINIPMEKWLSFFGFWLADGCCRYTKNSYNNERKVVSLKQRDCNLDYVKSVLNSLPFTYKIYKDKTKTKKPVSNIEINNEQLWSYLRQFGKSQDKFIPSFIKELNHKYLTIFLDNYFNGDGSVYQRTERIFRTSSKKLSEDLQEILLKTGYLSHITKYEYSTCTIYQITQNKKSNYTKIFYRSNKKDACKAEYNGLVWCLNLEKNGVFLLRRNNKEFFSGNCAEEFVRKSLKLVQNDRYVCMFLKLTFAEGKARKKLFNEFPPIRIWVSSSRINCAKNAEFKKYDSSAACYAWFIWQKGYKGSTQFNWFN